MQRNSLRSQYFSSLNPHALFQLPNSFVPNNRNSLAPSNDQASKQQERKTQSKKKFMTVVSKSKRPQKSLDSLRRSSIIQQNKKSNSVILGGSANSRNSFIPTQYSTKSSLCKSCVSETQYYKNNTALPLSYQQHSVQLNPPINILKKQTINIPVEIPIKKIIVQKLNLAAVQPYQSRLHRVNYQSGSENQAKNSSNTLHRRRISTGRIYSTSIDKQESAKQQKGQINFNTPRFDKESQKKKQQTNRKNGFIRSSSQKKYNSATFRQSNQLHFSQQKYPLKEFKYNTTDQKPLIGSAEKIYCTSGSVQLNNCLQKMSQIKKQISQLHTLMGKKLQVAEYRSKNLGGSSSVKSCKQDSMQNSFSHQMSSNIPNNPTHLSVSKNTTLVNGLYCQSLNQSKLTSKEYSTTSSIYKGSQQIQKPQTLTIYNKSKEYADKFCLVKYTSTPIRTQQQIINQIFQKHKQKRRNNDIKANQQNFIRAIERNPSSQKYGTHKNQQVMLYQGNRALETNQSANKQFIKIVNFIR